MQKILDDSGHITDMKAFKEALVMTIEKAIVVTDLSTLDEKLKEEQPIFVKIKAFIVFSDDVPVRAYFRKHKAKIRPSESLEEYISSYTIGSACPRRGGQANQGGSG